MNGWHFCLDFYILVIILFSIFHIFAFQVYTIIFPVQSKTTKRVELIGLPPYLSFELLLYPSVYYENVLLRSISQWFRLLRTSRCAASTLFGWMSLIAPPILSLLLSIAGSSSAYTYTHTHT